jgi:hypothetical protein
MALKHIFRRHYALPAEHGAWIWLFGPFILGWAAGSGLGIDLALLLGAGLAAFLLRQPATILVKVAAGRRGAHQRLPALVWTSIYASISLLLLCVLLLRGHHRLLVLGIPGFLVFAWHLWLVHRRQERGQMGIEIVAAGVLALMAPAAYWVSGGQGPLTSVILWLVSWFQASASIVHVYLRLTQRQWESTPTLWRRARMGLRSLSYSLFNWLGSMFLSTRLGISLGLPLAFTLQLLDVLDGVFRPAVGHRPATIGLRQLLFSALFFVLSGLAFSAWDS